MFIKLRGGNKMAYGENCNNPEGSTLWYLIEGGWENPQTQISGGVGINGGAGKLP